ncbi:hypothetical protein DYBT9275_04548 [Dyadobacter sp. CECT 9275]|uniref:Uncharacterized protein n=1 Tax=Dyadobacter helix TaxID=2822344 RepID=A0A916JJ80_9BACT|nr:DUF6686 family protein [Dyadobacter sp. CECT 9275]CAG5009678.1 hypothetical protein DYBT9275_04548 [Dyadobacter sp. CECT 9275]
MPEASHSYNSLRILSQSDRGYIGQCNCCDHYNFVFGNILFVFTEDGLRGFQSILYEQDHLHELNEALPHGKTHLLPSPIPNFMLSFDGPELEEIKNLFQETFLILEIDKIFSFKK